MDLYEEDHAEVSLKIFSCFHSYKCGHLSFCVFFYGLMDHWIWIFWYVDPVPVDYLIVIIQTLKITHIQYLDNQFICSIKTNSFIYLLWTKFSWKKKKICYLSTVLCAILWQTNKFLCLVVVYVYTCSRLSSCWKISNLYLIHIVKSFFVFVFVFSVCYTAKSYSPFSLSLSFYFYFAL